MWLTDPKNGKKSVTLTLFVITFVVALFKVMFSGITIYSITIDAFTAAEFATMIGSVGGIYGFRKYTDKEKDK